MNLFSPYAKAYIALIGSLATALLGVFASDTPIGQALTVVAVLATAYGTFRVPNAKVVDASPDGPDDGGDEPVVVTGATPEEVADAVQDIDQPVETYGEPQPFKAHHYPPRPPANALPDPTEPVDPLREDPAVKRLL